MIYVTIVGERHRCYTTADGRTRKLVGCAHLGPREAIRHAEALDATTRPATSWPQDSDLARALGNGTAHRDAGPAASRSPVEDPSPRRATPRRATG